MTDAANFLPRSSRLSLLLLWAMMFALFTTSCSSASIPACVNDPASVSTLQNTNLTYFEKVALFYANHDAEDNYSTSILVGQHNNGSSVRTPPYFCPQLAPSNVFIAGTFWNFYFEHSAVSNVQNATTEGVTCGLRCSSKSTGVSFDTVGNSLAYHLHFAYGPVTRIINGTSVTRNESYNTDNETTVFCTANVPNTTTLDTVCVAHIQYNSTYSESGTGFALPSVGLFAAGILDPANTTLSAGVASTFSIWLPPSLTFCPWFYEAGFLSSDEGFMTLANFSTSAYYLPRVAPSITIGFAFNRTTVSGVSTTASTTLQFPLIGAKCEIASPHPISGGVGVRYVGVVPPSTLFSTLDGFFLKNVTSDAMTLEYFNYAYFLPLLTASAPGVALLNNTEQLPAAPITYQGTMVPSLSRWWPEKDYTKPELSSIPRRCYSSSPKTVSNDPTTVYFPSLSCTCGTHDMMEEVVNSTSFCCFMNTTSAAFVWPAFIDVYDVGTHWFTDTAGIIATPTPSRATVPGAAGGGTPSPIGGSSAHDDVSGSGYASSSSDGPSSSSNGEDTALILGISILGISAVVVVMVLVYFKWWKPRQESGGNTMSDHQKHRNDTTTAPQLLGVLSDPLLVDGQRKSNNTLDMYDEEANQMHDGLL